MKIKVSKLTDAALDWAVAKCKGITPIAVKKKYSEGHILYSIPTSTVPLEYASKWAQGGPIIESEGIDICTSTRGGWIATLLINCENDEVARGEGETCLIAAMRCYVTSKLGLEIDVPNELI